MQQEELQQIQKWCQQSEDAILFYAPDGTLLWQNDAAAVRQKPQNSSLPRYHKNSAPEDGMFLLRQGGSLYCVRQEPRQYGEKPAILVQIHSQPADDLLWSDADKQHETENRIAAMRQKIFGISNAVSGLYQTLEENGDQIPRMVLEEQMEQLNIIQGNCCRLMRPSVLWLEQLKYVQKNELSGEALFLDRELSNFVESCRMVLGKALKMTADAEKPLCIFANRRRLQICLLCMVLYLRDHCPEISRLTWQTEQQGDQVVLRCTAVSDGTEPPAHRHSQTEHLYDTHFPSPEEQIVQKFCRTYHAAVLFSAAEEMWQYTLRFPLYEHASFLSLESSRTTLDDGMFSLYQIFLSDISEYRFY